MAYDVSAGRDSLCAIKGRGRSCYAGQETGYRRHHHHNHMRTHGHSRIDMDRDSGRRVSAKALHELGKSDVICEWSGRSSVAIEHRGIGVVVCS